jgi:protein-tyrosine phosphatase
VRNPPPFVDIHCHLIPGIDDGAKDWVEALSMARMAVEDGICTVVVTPHQLGNYAANDGPAVRASAAELQDFLDDQNVPLTVLPGADVRIESDLVRRIRRGEVVSLADHRRHVLLELPHELYVPLDGLLADLAADGITGILSHPERNAELLTSPGVIAELVDAGCLMQVTAGSLLGTFGPRIERYSQKLLEDGMVHFLATDAHGPQTRRPLLRRAFDRTAGLVGWETAVELCCRNPLRVSQGLAVQGGVVAGKRRAWSGWRMPWRRVG